MNTPHAPAFGVYVHWPFCAAKCPYCDFNSHVRHQPVDQKIYRDGFLAEISHMASLAPGRNVTSIFFGGGTPSLMQPDTVGAIIEAIADHWTLDEHAEITLEANPSSVEAEKFRGFHAAGVNRVSLGIQSLDDAQLRFLGRLHSADEAVRAIATAREIFPRMSIDMIYARPKQTCELWQAELSRAISLAADHLSLYQLTIEQGTPFFDLRKAGKLKVPGENLAAELYEITQETTSAAGFSTYEISNHAKPGAECRHNLLYWRGQEYAGVGPGAHGRLQTDAGRLATATLKNPEKWWQQAMVTGHGLEESFVLANDEQADELLLMGLRLAEGFDPQRCEALYGRDLQPEKREFLVSQGLLEHLDNGWLRATPKGFLLLDAIVADLAA